MGTGWKRARDAAIATQPPTKGQIRCLEYMRGKEYVSQFPVEGPTLAMARKCEARGWIERAGHDPGTFGFVRYRLSELGERIVAYLESGEG